MGRAHGLTGLDFIHIIGLEFIRNLGLDFIRGSGIVAGPGSGLGSVRDWYRVNIISMTTWILSYY